VSAPCQAASPDAPSEGYSACACAESCAPGLGASLSKPPGLGALARTEAACWTDHAGATIVPVCQSSSSNGRGGGADRTNAGYCAKAKVRVWGKGRSRIPTNLPTLFVVDDRVVIALR
jgi:hypothetical protein